MFDLSKKKKKKKKKTKTEGEDEEGAGEGEALEEGEGRYNYETLLERIQVRLLAAVARCRPPPFSVFLVLHASATQGLPQNRHTPPSAFWGPSASVRAPLSYER